MTATDPTPQPATHASGPRAGQPVGAPLTAPVVVLEDALCRRVWAGALRWKAGQLRDAAEHQRHTGQADVADAMRVCASALEIDAHRIETGELTPWADQPEPPAASAQLDIGADIPTPTSGASAQVSAENGGDIGTDAGPVQRRCTVAHPRHGQCELYQGHRPADDPDRRHRTGALSWLTDAEVEACGLPPLASYAGAADLQSGPANASGESAGGLAGDGWARRPLLELAEWLETGPAETRDPDIGRQVRAVLADRDLHVGALDTRSTQLYDALAERDAARAEVARLQADPHGEPAPEPDGEHQVRRIAARGVSLDYEQEALAGVARSWRLSDPACQALALADAQVWATLQLAEVTAERSQLTHELARVTADREALFRTHEWAVAEHERELAAARAELATARRDAAAQHRAADGPGWDRTTVEGLIDRSCADATGAELDQLRALLADADQWEGWVDRLVEHIPEEEGDDVAVEGLVEQWMRKQPAIRDEIRRDAAAEALVFGAGLAVRWGEHDLAADMRLIAAEVRDGTRPVPGSPEPAPAGGEGPDHG
jgi:hypothetical protein